MSERRSDEAQLVQDRVDARSDSEHFRILVQSVVDYAIYMLDAEGRVSTWNPGAERIKGYSTDEIVGEHFSRFYTTEDRTNGEPARALERARTEGRYEAEAERVRKDGTRFWAHVVIDPIFSPDGALLGYAKITRDISERRAAVEELQTARTALMQAQKMEAIGQLTGGIAHDFNNMLAGIIGGLNLIQRRLNDKRYDEAGAFIEAALSSANRAAQLTKRLLAFGRRQTLDIRSLDLNEVIGSMRILLDRTMGENVRTEMRFETPELLAATDVNQLESAILNLAINARDAMPRGGTLTIATRACRSDEHLPMDALGPPDQFVLVSVSDTGVGMPADILHKVFDPFFTTKPIGQGTGLGLSMVYGFVSQAGGHVEIESAVGKGTTLTLWLPKASKAVVAPEPQRPPSEGEVGSGETVLVVEDDPQLRILILAVLKDIGYRAIEASDPDQALAVLESDRRIDLLVTDVGLPRIDGRVLARLARRRRPDLKVLFITGYAQHASLRTEFLGDGMDLLMKPFSLEVLASKIREMTR